MSSCECEPAEKLEIPDLIRARRKEAGYSSQEALGEALGTTRIHVNAWETGRNTPSEQYARKLAEVIGGAPGDYQNHDGPRRRVEEAEALRLLASQTEALAESNREVLELLGEIRNLVARLVPAADETVR